MGSGCANAAKDEQEVGVRKGGLSLDRGAKASHTTGHSSRDQDGLAGLAYVRVEGLKLPAYARQIRVHGLRVDMT